MALGGSTGFDVEDQRLIRHAMRAPLLSRDQEQKLARRWREQSDQQALKMLVSSHSRLVVSVAARYRGYGLPLSDLMQEGHLGLITAVERYDPDRGVRLSTYANWWIRAAIQDFVLRNWSIVRVGSTSSEKSLFFNLRRLRARLAHRSTSYNSYDTSAAIARELSLDVRRVNVMEFRLALPDQSANASLGEEDNSTQWQDLLVDDRPSPEAEVLERNEAAWLSERLAAAMRNLPERERFIIRERHLREKSATLEQLGRRLGLSKERVRQLEQRALQTLRRHFT
jgi:RNA polymerase sigma-32 factor